MEVGVVGFGELVELSGKEMLLVGCEDDLEEEMLLLLDIRR